tara:strand:+ start:10240 stop:11241 length:1002 start_codon:yes stop_codon:yes gene_type:complete
MKYGSKTIKSFVAAGAILVGSHASALSAQITDFVFMIDATGSMGGEIAGVRNGFSSFVGGLNAASVDARFAVVVFGGASELTLDFTSDTAATQAALNAITLSANPGIQNNHNVNPEAGLETIRQVLGAAPNSTLDANNIAADGNLYSRFRSGARKNLILVTDEDSDAAYRAANRFAGQPGFGGTDGYAGDSPTTLTAGWQAEVDATAQAVIQSQAYLNMLVGLEGSSEQQYGDYRDDVADADLLNFDGAATLANLLADSETDDSLQAQVLGAGLVARTFNVAGANDSDFIDNFFAAKLEEVITDPGVLPEPGMIAIFGLGFAGLVCTRRRRPC